MVEINRSILIQIANFLFLIFVLNLVLYKPIRRVLQQRKTKIDSLETRIRSTGEESDERKRAFSDGIKKARMEGQQKKETLMQAAMDEEKAIIAQINAKAQEDLAAVKEKINRDIDAVKASLEKEVDGFADSITQKILGRAA